MVDIELLHLWRGSYVFGTNNQFQMMDQTRIPELEQKMFARSAGTAERFRIRIHEYGSLTAISVRFKVNGVVQRTIGPVPAGQLGVKLPANQLPVAFAKNDELVMDIIGVDEVLSNKIEWNVDLKFVEDVIPPGGIDLPATDTIRSIRTGGSTNHIHQFSHYTKRPFHSGSSSWTAPLIGKKVTHIRMRSGTTVNDHGIYVAVYEGDPTAEASIKSHSLIYNQGNMTGGQIYDIPLVVPYIIGTNDPDEIYLTIAVVGGFPGVEMRGDDTNFLRQRITYGIACTGFASPPDWPFDFTCNESSLSGDTPEFQLINEDTIPGGILPIP